VINATGVVVHTNLGRAPLSREARARVAEIASSYSNLELDLGTASVAIAKSTPSHACASS
jgi:L-seryl-tRNA(Ser) seleniumtransferase